MKKVLVVVFMLFAIPIYAGDWTRKDTYRELAWTAMLIVDYGQTMNIARNPEKYKEYNPILGDHPSESAVNLYMLSVAVIHPVVSYYLPPKYRKIWQYVTIGVEVGAVANSLSVGITF